MNIGKALPDQGVAYSRIDHFNQLLNEINPSDKVSNKLIEDIKAYLNEHGIHHRLVSKKDIRQYLNENQMQTFYEIIPQILYRIRFGLTSPRLSQQDMEILRYLFIQLAYVYELLSDNKSFCFLSYNYLLFRLFQLLELDEFLEYLFDNSDPLNPKSMQTIDKIWIKICDQLGWPRPPWSFRQQMAQQKIAHWWLRIQSQRRLVRLRIGRELEYLPGVGVHYQTAKLDFMQQRDKLKNYK